MRNQYSSAILFLLGTLGRSGSHAFPAPSVARFPTSGRPAVPQNCTRCTGGAFAESDSDPAARAPQNPDAVPSARKLLPKLRKVASVLLPVLAAAVTLSTRPVHAASSASGPRKLGFWNVWSATALLVSIGALPLSMSGLGSLSRSLLASACRCAVQVSLLGSIVLQRMMGVEHPALVAAWVLGVGLVTGATCLSRIQYDYPGMNRNMYGSIVAGGLTVLGLTMSLQLFGAVQPWFNPQTWIPIAGMLFGNTLNAAALGGASITKQFATRSDSVELRLARGATVSEAIRPLVEESYGTALMPTINSLAATGIIHIPGMMSGQILAGQSPQQAALYQIVISFLIGTTALLTVRLVINSSVGAMVDARERRLRVGVLEPKKNGRTTLASLKSIASLARWKAHAQPPTDGSPPRTASCKKVSPTRLSSATNRRNDNKAPVLAIQDLEVVRANVEIDLVLRPGDRVAISGKSGIGKSQILRTIVGLEKGGKGENSISLLGNPLVPSDLPEFRSRVSLVPQMNPVLEGTPNQFYDEIVRCQSQQRRRSSGDPVARPSNIASAWGLEAGAFDRPWRTLSGGESQRAALAIALALEPDVLLLDESTGALDEATSRMVERTLRKSNIPMLVVTHSEAQLGRFCTHRLDLQ